MRTEFKAAAKELLRKKWLKYAEGIEVTRLPNGVQVITHKIPRLFALSSEPGLLSLMTKPQNEIAVVVQAGSGHEKGRYPAGTAHYLEQAITYGSANVPGIDEATDGIPGFNGKIDAYTSRWHTRFIIKTSPQNTKDAVFILSDLTARPNLEPENIEKDRPKILRERTDGLMNHGRELSGRFFQTAFNGGRTL